MGTKTKPNWLLRILVVTSLGIHALIFARLSEVYRSHHLNFIELTLQDISNPVARVIPRPRSRPKKPPLPVKVKKITLTNKRNKLPKSIKLQPMKMDYPDSLVESIGGSSDIETNALGLAQWNPNIEPFVEYTSPDSYLDMVKLRIERAKKYPENAKDGHIEGQITIRFILTQKGTIKSAEIIKKSNHEILNQAALAAVKNAGPFQKPPSRFFKGDIILMVTIIFELT